LQSQASHRKTEPKMGNPVQTRRFASRSLAAVALLLGLLLATPRLSAQQAPAPAPNTLGPAERWVEARRVDRLEASLFELAHADGLIRQWGGVGALVLGGTLIVGGVLVALQEEGWGGNGRAAVSGIAWCAGASLIAAGIYRWFSRTPAEERMERWSNLRLNKRLDVFEFARFEGELQSAAEDAAFGRRLTAFSSIGIMAGGAGLIGLSASSELDGDAETTGYVMGGALVGVGVIQMVALLLRTTPAERAWEQYSQGGSGFSLNLRLDPELVVSPVRF
jgi:predicted phage tail protein